MTGGVGGCADGVMRDFEEAADGRSGRLESLLVGLAFLTVGLLLLVGLSSPLWFGLLLGRIGADHGLEFERYERLGWGRFGLDGVVWEDRESGLVLRIDRIEVPSPVFALVRLLYTRDPLLVRAGEVQTVVSTVRGGSRGSPPVVATFDALVDGLQLASGFGLDLGIERFAVQDQGFEGEFLNLSFSERALRVEGCRVIGMPDLAGVGMMVTPTGNVLIEGQIPEWTTTLDATLIRLPDGLGADGIGSFDGHPVFLGATWVVGDRLPRRAELFTDALQLPDGLLKELRLDNATVSARLNWEDGMLEVEATGRGSPFGFIELSASGDEDHLSIQRLLLNLPYLRLTLDEPLALRFDALNEVKPLRLAVDVDLSRQDFIDASGKLSGTVGVMASAGSAPLAVYLLEADDLSYADFPPVSGSASGTLAWPECFVELASVRSGDAFEAVTTGTVNLESWQLGGIEGFAELDGGFLAEYVELPRSVEKATATFRFDGSLDDLETSRHAGHAFVSGVDAGLNEPLDVQFKWDGVGAALSIPFAGADGEKMRVRSAGSVHRVDGSTFEVEVDRLTGSWASWPTTILEQPVRIELTPTGLSIGETQLVTASGARIEFSGSTRGAASGRVELNLFNLPSADLDAWIPVTGQRLRSNLRHLGVAGGWDQGVVSGRSEMVWELLPRNLDPVVLEGSARLHSAGSFALERFVAMQGDDVLFQADAVLPVAVEASNSEAWAVAAAPSAPLVINAKVVRDSAVWELVRRQTGWSFSGASVFLASTGSLDAPVSILRAEADRLSFDRVDESGGMIPEIRDIRVTGDLSRERITLQSFEAHLGSGDVFGRGTLPMGTAQWKRVFLGEMPDLVDASALLRLDPVRLESIEKVLPQELKPKGAIQAELVLEPPLNVSGFASLSGWETRPLGDIGSISDLEVLLEVDGRRAHIAEATAMVGNRDARLLGWIGLGEKGGLEYDLFVDGDSVPLARRPGLVLRGSPSLRLQSDSGTGTRLSGTLKLDDGYLAIPFQSLFEADINARENSRIPGVTHSPLDGWMVDVQATGFEFFRIASPFFEGTVSADLAVEGTLGEPFVSGNIPIASGWVKFPFGALAVEQAEVFFRPEAPNVPGIQLSASGRLYSVDVQLQISGTADDPQVLFTSVPSLPSSDILLMLTTGRLPNAEQRSAGSRFAGIGSFLGTTILSDLGITSPGEQRFQLTTGEDITDQGKDTISAEWRIDDDWSIEGTYDRFDSYNVDGRWIFFRR